MLQKELPYIQINRPELESTIQGEELCQLLPNLIEMLLQFFIGKIDTELLKTVNYRNLSATVINISIEDKI